MKNFSSLRALLLLVASALAVPSFLLAQVAKKPAPQPAPRIGFRIAGTVVNAKTSQPLARAEVSVTDTKNPKNSQSMVTS